MNFVLIILRDSLVTTTHSRSHSHSGTRCGLAPLREKSSTASTACIINKPRSTTSRLLVPKSTTKSIANFAPSLRTLRLKSVLSLSIEYVTGCEFRCDNIARLTGYHNSFSLSFSLWYPLRLGVLACKNSCKPQSKFSFECEF